ncbi:hypothetical protein BC938DRAFT_470827 [Jimgerdemannia flammicorona]|uniref:RING-type domain-containing protein n=1 Tax=Jimgerdemannia flammicorona TaxID=994334 RepID=A0A433Q9C4_9FUNG|nr:hypothetical protein BC938DRAFT_470827 [Jimgerdemannia flammicorona]
MSVNMADPAEASRNDQSQQRLTMDHPLQPRDGSGGADEPSQRNLAHCCICLEDNPTDEGLTCPHQHFVCDECLGNYFESRANIENIQTHRLRLPCPIPNCDAPSFAPLRDIAAHLPPLAAGIILGNLDSVLEVFTERIQQQKLAENVRQLQQLSPQDDIERRRLHVVDNILTIKRPCCKMAFVDFTGCCALYCPNCPPPHNAFCAICLASCGADAHEHVRVEHGNAFMTEEQWKAHHNLRRQGQLLEYLRGPGTNCNRGALLDALRGDLAGLGMNVEEIRVLLPEAVAVREVFQRGEQPVVVEGLPQMEEQQRVVVEGLPQMEQQRGEVEQLRQREQQLLQEQGRVEQRWSRATRRWIIIGGVTLFLALIAISTALGMVVSQRGGDASVDTSASTTMAATTLTYTAETVSTLLTLSPTLSPIPSPTPSPTSSPGDHNVDLIFCLVMGLLIPVWCCCGWVSVYIGKICR